MKLKTIQELARLSGVSTRTLRYYNEIGLLFPKVQMANGRSLYGIKEIIYLTQIITFKEFGFSLNKIKSILHNKQIHKLSRLIAQKKILNKELDRLKASLHMIESMIHFYQEKPMLEMTPEQIETHFEQIKSKKEYMKYFDEAFMEEKTRQFQEQFRLKYGVFLNKLHQAIEQKLRPESTEVQTLVQEQWEILQIVYPETCSQNIYFAIRDQLCDFAAEEKQGAALRDFLYQAMTNFGQGYFSE